MQLSSGDAAEKVVLALDAGDDGHQRIEAPALGQGVERLGGEDLSPRLALDVDERGLAGDDDGRQALRLAGVATVTLIGGFIGLMWIRDRRKLKTAALAPSGSQ